MLEASGITAKPAESCLGYTRYRPLKVPIWKQKTQLDVSDSATDAGLAVDAELYQHRSGMFTSNKFKDVLSERVYLWCGL